ncbi:MAG: hypothetical protein ABJC12_05990 [Saprospiraceae bacterium]
MKKFLFLFLFSPLFGSAQTPEHLMFEISSLNVSPEKVPQVEAALGVHNKKYHASGPYGSRVYTVQNGAHTGQFKWVMGPGTWSSLDARPSDEMHDLDWSANVAVNLMSGTETEYIQFDNKLSRFPVDFNVNRLLVRYIDVARGKMDKVKELLGKVLKVYTDKIPGETYGIYYNELASTSSGRDLMIVSFFDKYAWMAMDDGFEAKYDEVYGKGSITAFWNEWRDATVAQETELWEYSPEMSGMSAAVKAAERK